MSKLKVYDMAGRPSGMTGTIEASQLLARVQRIEDIVPYQLRGGSFASQGRNKYRPLDSTGIVNGKLDLRTASGINFQGIMAPCVVDGAFTIACPSDSSATIYYDGTNSSRVFVLRRADGTTTTVPGNNITITGLTFSVQYAAYPFWTPFNTCGVGWGTGAEGTPQIAVASTDSNTTALQAQALQSLAGREPLGIISWTQPGSGSTSSATGSSTPPTRDPGTCVRLGTHIEPLGSYGPNDVQQFHHKQDDWIHLETENGFVLECTPDHTLYHAEHGKMKAEQLAEGDKVITRAGERKITAAYPFIRTCTKVEVRMNSGHLYYANGFLSHNVKLPSS